MANKASRDTARRVAAARKHQAQGGQYSASGKRPYGFKRDGVTVREDEAAEIRKWAEALLDGAPVRQITADLRRRAVPTVTGTSWKPTSVRQILRRPRNAAILVYQGEEVGKAPRPAILPEHTWRAVCAILEDPARRTTPGNTPKWLLSGLALCGVCKEPVQVWGQSIGRTAYRCRSHHVQRAVGRLDEFVTAAIVVRMTRPDAIDLLKPHSPAPDVAALRREVATLQARLNEQARLHARAVIDAEQLAAGSAELRSEIQLAERELAATAQRSPLDGLAGRPDAGDVWESLSLGIKRAALAELCTVILQPAYHGRLPGGSYFDTSTIEFRDPRTGQLWSAD